MRRIRNFVLPIIVPRRNPRRDWPSNWATNRDCTCPPAERIVEPDGACFRCGGRVVQRSPFHPDGWSRG